jgi:hypothetical protein
MSQKIAAMFDKQAYEEAQTAATILNYLKSKEAEQGKPDLNLEYIAQFERLHTAVNQLISSTIVGPVGFATFPYGPTPYYGPHYGPPPSGFKDTTNQSEGQPRY